MAPSKALPNVRGSLQEVIFAQRLADNEKKNRDKALKKLKTFLSVKSSSNVPGFSDDDALKIWKGLFYCMYMADKPLIQEDVAEEISYLIHDLGNLQDCRTFTKAAFRTFAREWNGIDVFRIDKFMMFMRRVLRQVFVHLKQQKWNLKEVARYVNILDMCIIRADDNTNNTPLGLKLHLCSIIMEELAKIGGEDLEHEVIVAVIQPYFKVLALSKIKHYRETVGDEIIRHLMRQTDLGIQYEDFLRGRGEVGEEEEGEAGVVGEEEEEEKRDAEVQEEDDNAVQDDVEMTDDRTDEEFVLDPRAGSVNVYIPQLYPDFNLLAEALQRLGEIKKVGKASRKQIYTLVKELQDIARGVYPLTLPEIKDESDIEDSEKEEEEAVERLQKFYDNLGKPAETNIDKMGDLKTDALSKYSIRKGLTSKKYKKKKVKSVEKKLLTYKQKQAVAKQQRSAELNRQKAVETKITEMTKTVAIPSSTNSAKRKKIMSRSGDKGKGNERKGNKVGGFDVSTITSGTNKNKSDVSSEVNSFEVSTIVGKKRKSPTESKEGVKKIKNSFDVTDLSLPAHKADVKKKKHKKSNITNGIVNKVVDVSSVDSGTCKDEGKINVINSVNVEDGGKSNKMEKLPKEKTGVPKEPCKASMPLGSAVINTLQDKESVKEGMSNIFDVPAFTLEPETFSQPKSPGQPKSASQPKSPSQPKSASQPKSLSQPKSASQPKSPSQPNSSSQPKSPSQPKSATKKIINKEEINTEIKARSQDSPKEKIETKKSKVKVNTEEITGKSECKLNKTVVPPSCTNAGSVQKSPVLKSPSKSDSVQDKGLVINFSENKVGSVWSKPLKGEEIDLFIKNRREKVKPDKKTKSLALRSPKVTSSRTPRTPKERSIKINLKQNQEHEFKDYVHSVRNSPQIPFSADKVPRAPVLKPSPSPILIRGQALSILKNVIRRASPAASGASSPAFKGKKSPKGKKLKRSNAADFF